MKKATSSLGMPVERDDKRRPISFPAHKDGYIFSFYKSLLEPRYEEWLANRDLCTAVTAFRKIGQSNVSLAKKVFDFISNSPNCEIYVTDIDAFFDSINHVLLKQKWAKLLAKTLLPPDHYAVFRAITNYSYIERHKVYNLFRIPMHPRSNNRHGLTRVCTPEKFRSKVVSHSPNLIHRNPGAASGIGIPQGSSISPLLANAYMMDFDRSLNEMALSVKGAYWRYCDDILIVVPRGNLGAVEQRVDQELNALQLSRNKAKTHSLDSNNLESRPLQYLGLIFNGSRITVRPSSIHRYHRKLKKALQAAKIRQQKESITSGGSAPLRQQALYNMYSELPIRGKKIKSVHARRRYTRNFLGYLTQSSGLLGSKPIVKQRLRLQKKFRTVIKKQC